MTAEQRQHAERRIEELTAEAQMWNASRDRGRLMMVHRIHREVRLLRHQLEQDAAKGKPEVSCFAQGGQGTQ
jgi:hypothetical protein